MNYLVFLFLLSGCTDVEKQEILTKYPDVPPYSIVEEIKKEEEKWNQKK